MAGLVPALERSPCRPGSVWVTSSSTETGSSMYSAAPSLKATCTVMPSSRKRWASPTSSGDRWCCS
ncbi:Uncharacterised protein [Mycobacteroides abscessus subsp. abscessus]|nr:Uncharacterised protein [Mycobacteroides abscessus subsp. abscessus]